MGSPYQRQDVSNNIANGNVINADDLDAEFNALETAFAASTGHSHDGTTGEGGPITVVGPAQDLIISGTQVLPKTDNTLDLGSSALEFKNLWIDGTGNIDSLVADTADINGGTIDGAVIGGTTPAAGTFTTLTATSGTVGGVAVTTASNTQTLTNKTVNLASNTLIATSAQIAAAVTDETGTGALVFAGSPALTGTPTAPTAAAGTNTTQVATTAHVFAERTNAATLTNKTLTSPTVNSPTISGGTINNTVIGGTTPVSGTFTALAGTTSITSPLFSAGLGVAASPSISFTGDSNTGIWSPAADTFAISTGGVERVRIDSAGEVGIGTNSPQRPLHILTSGVTPAAAYLQNDTGDSIIFLRSQDTGSNSIQFGDTTSFNSGLIQYTHVNNALNLRSEGLTTFQTGGANERMRLHASGGVSIGNIVDPGATNLSVTGSISAASGTLGGVGITTASNTQTLTNKTVNLANNTLIATSAQIAAAVSDETGTGALVFANSPALAGTPTAPTAAAGTNTTQVATTAHVFAERTNTATLTNKTLTSPTINTATISGGTINNTPIGSTTRNSGAFTTLNANGNVVLGDAAGDTVTVNGTATFVNGAVGVGGSAVASAQLDVQSTTKGFLPPRMTTTQRNAIASPANGLVIYNTTLNRAEVYSSIDAAWVSVGTPTTRVTGSSIIPSGTTAQRDSVPATGYIRFNLDTNSYEGYNGSEWSPVGGGGQFKGNNGTVGIQPGDIFRVNSKLLTVNTTIGATENASAAGPIEVDTGVTLTVTSGGTLVIV